MWLRSSALRAVRSAASAAPQPFLSASQTVNNGTVAHKDIHAAQERTSEHLLCQQRLTRQFQVLAACLRLVRRQRCLLDANSAPKVAPSAGHHALAAVARRMGVHGISRHLHPAPKHARHGLVLAVARVGFYASEGEQNVAPMRVVWTLRWTHRALRLVGAQRLRVSESSPAGSLPHIARAGWVMCPVQPPSKCQPVFPGPASTPNRSLVRSHRPYARTHALRRKKN